MRLISRYVTFALLAAALAAAWLAAPPARAQTAGNSNDLPATTCAITTGVIRHCNLIAAAGSVTLPTATGSTAVPVWSYTDGTGAVGAVGPTLVAQAGETLEIGLTNNLAEPTSLAIPGLLGAADSVGAAAGGGTQTYSFANLPAGTYLYQAGVLTGSGPRQAAMGLFGALIVRPATAGRAYDTAASAYDDEALLVYSEIDPSFNANPIGFKLQSFKPVYLLINGRVYPNTTAVGTTAGHKLLLRQVNAGVQFHSTGALGLRQTIIADDGAPLAAPVTLVARTIGPGQTFDSIVSVPAAAVDGTRYPLYDTALPANGPGGAGAMGGMLTFITVGAPTPPAPTPTPLPVADTTAPFASGASALPALGNGSSSLSLAALVSDVGRGNSTIVAAEYSLDGGTAVPIVGFTPAPQLTLGASIPAATVAGLANGTHTVAIRAQDAAGNWSAPASASFKLDRVGPQTTGNVSPASVAPGAALQLSASFSDVASGASNLTSAEYAIDGGAPVALTASDGTFNSPSESAQVAISSTSLSGGAHSLSVRAQDGAGNWGPVRALAFTVDDTLFASTFEAPAAATAPFGWTSTGGTAARLSLVTTSQIAGARSLRATINNGNSGFVQQSLGATQTKLRARIYLNPTGLSFGSNSAATTARTLFRAANGASEAFRLELRRTSTTGTFQVRAVVGRQNGTTTTSWYNLSASGASYVELAWQQSASAQFQLYVNGTLSETLSNLATSGFSVSTVQLGPQGSLSGISNGSTILFDNVKLTRTVAIGAN